MIELKNAYKVYKSSKKNKVIGLDNISLTFPNKGLIFITGASGSGKSTLLNTLGLLDNLDSGSIIVDGKNVSSLKNKEIDFYRNTFVGFIFQEYNLLDNFNVRKNVEISLNLQGNKNIEKVNEVLKKVELSGLENRKINELSGGQKQRVAIARALVKNPKLILADEPTGNLDSKVSEQIIKILKDISKDKLVIVVTHDLELAKKYGERVIEIKDGRICKDSNNEMIEEKNDNFKLIKSKLPLLKSISLSFSNLKRKKIKLSIIILLLAVSFSIFGFSLFLTNFNIDKTHAETMIQQNETRIDIVKKINGKNFTYYSHVPTFTKDEVNEVLSKINNNNTVIVSKVSENDNFLSMEEPKFNMGIQDTDDSAYYSLYVDNTLFLEYDDSRLNNLKLIGSIPITEHDIIINKVYADYIIKRGLQIVKTNSKNQLELASYNPKSYEEIVNDKTQIKFGSTYLTISGIIDEDISKYDSLKTTPRKEMEINSTKLYDEFINIYGERLKEIIVKKDFFEKLDLKKNDILNVELYKLVYNFNDKKIYPSSNLKLLNDTLTYYDGTKNKVINKLENNEIIISTYTLDQLYDNNYTKGLFEKISKENETYNRLNEERNKKIKEIEKELLNNPDLEIEYPEEIPEVNEEKIREEYLKKFVKDNNVLNQIINIDINDMYLRVNNTKTTNHGDFKIVGISDNYDFVSFDSEFNKYMLDNREVTSVYFDANNKDEIYDIFKIFPTQKAEFVSKTIYSNIINEAYKVVKHITKIAKYATIGALIFSIILFMYFILTSINSNKKTIGILRALGAKITDIYKIFYLEVFIVGGFTLLLSTMVCYFGVNIANKYISTDMFINIKPIVFNTNIILYLIIILFILISISFIIPILKISKTKPIDVINNK